jgi:hypothetical protein
VCVLGVFGLLVLCGFPYTSLCTQPFVIQVNILRVISVSGCRLFKSNHLNFGILYDCVIYYYVIFFFLGIPES